MRIHSPLLVFVIVILLAIDLHADNNDLNYVDWNYRLILEDEKDSKSSYTIPEWSGTNSLISRHFQTLTGPLSRLRIEFDPPLGASNPDRLPFVFELKIHYGDGSTHILRFLSSLELVGTHYVNDFLMLSRNLKYEISPLDLKQDKEIVKIFSKTQIADQPTNFELSFTLDQNFYGLIEKYSTCDAQTDSAFFSLYRFVESTLARKFLSSCENNSGVYLFDQRDWVDYLSPIYQMEKRDKKFYIALKNDLEIWKAGRSPNHIKMFSPNENVAMLTTSTITLNSSSGDDWVVVVKGKQGVRDLKDLILSDLLWGKFQKKIISKGITAFSSGTIWRSKSNTLLNSKLSREPREYDSMVLEDLRSAKNFVTFYNPVLLNIGRHNYDYKQLHNLLYDLTQKGVLVNLITTIPAEFETPSVSKLVKSGKFFNIVPHYSFDSTRSIGTIHARLINIDARVCYLFTGHMANIFSNELGFRIENQDQCRMIKAHIEKLYDRSNFQNLLVLGWSGILKLFRINNLFSFPRAFNFIVNGENKDEIDMEKLQPLTHCPSTKCL